MPSKNITLTAEQIVKITRRTQLQREIAEREVEEQQLRKELVECGIFSTLDSKTEGTQTVAISNYPGWRLQAKKVQNYNMTNSDGQTEAALYELEKVNPSISAVIVKWKPTLAEGAFKKLPREQQELFTAALTITKGMPTLELLPPTAAMLAEGEE
jgi:hypothetical protein